MMGKLDGKSIIITGAASGIGKQLSIRCAVEGANVAICSRTEAKLLETKRICEEKGVKAFAMPLDIRNYDSLVAFVDGAVKELGTIDGLVNNAHTITKPAPFMDKTVEDLDTEIQSSLYAYWHLMKLCFPYLKDKPGAGTSVVNFASEAAISGDAFYAPYACAKEAVRGLSRVVAREWGLNNIRVNTLCPNGLTDNIGSLDDLQSLSEAVREHVKAAFVANPFKRVGDPYEDVAPAVVFLLSNDSRWITGQNIHADGGALINA
jgi:NAD(P)-dependent dehydrogenase (short-subunit alcohol dehydrogenase family)